MNKNILCLECDKNICDKQYAYCATCINQNINHEMCKNIMMFNVNTDNTNICICGSTATITCVLQSCKKCCNIKNCKLHTKIMPKFIYNVCSLCGSNNKILNYYCLDDNLISYCSTCYNKNKESLNLLIFNNATNSQQKKLLIPISENNKEKTQRIKILKINKEKQIIKKKNKENKKNMFLIMNSIDDDIMTNDKLKEYIPVINNDLMEMLIDYVNYVCGTCNSLCELEDIYYCKYCEIYKCIDCMLYECTICDNNNCIYPQNFCKNTLFKCIDCGYKIINDFNKKNNDEKITSKAMISNNIDIVDFENKHCDKIFCCEICNEDINLTHNKISKCNTCKDFFCKNCGVFTYKSNNFFNNDENIIMFTCKNCSIINDKIITNNNDDIIIIKPRAFTKLEKDILAKDEYEECAICYTNKKIFACIPCGHLCLCYKCKNNIEPKCPICNEETDSIVKIFA